MALTLDATSAGMRPILIKRARATSLPAFVSVRYQVELREKPGCDGVATRLPKDPGVQKLSPLSSAQAGGATEASAAAMAPPARRCGHARCRALGALIPILPFPRRAPVLIGKPVPTFPGHAVCACPYRKTGSHPGSSPGRLFPGHAPTPARPRQRPPTPADYTESLARERGRRARSWARHEECRRLLPVGNSATRGAVGTQLGREARITLRERSRHWQPNGHGSAGQAETTGRKSGLTERGSGLAERASGLTTRTASRSPLAATGATSGVISGATSPRTSAAGLGLLSAATSAVTCWTASTLTSDLPPASAVTTAAPNAKAARAAATLYRDI